MDGKEEKKRRHRAYNREWYQRHRDRLAAKRAEERAADINAHKAGWRAYYEAKKETILGYQAKYRDANREKINAKARAKRRAAREAAKEL